MLVRIMTYVTIFRNVSARGNCRLTARMARVAGVNPWAQMSTLALLSFLSSDLDVETCAAAVLADKSIIRNKMLSEKLLRRSDGILPNVKPMPNHTAATSCWKIRMIEESCVCGKLPRTS